MTPEVERFLIGLGNTILWSTVSIVIVVAVFEVLDRKYKLMNEIFEENSTAAAVLAASFVLGVFYVVAQIVIH
ncbi:MAG: DUF350 domain-containing protein [Bacteroidetes bacterium]|nr:DUF350 domain-containing protein [Bacteroidota bacterium]MCL5026964.1 DUF350 domain-containing protein [Chloroflexota bacterium]